MKAMRPASSALATLFVLGTAAFHAPIPSLGVDAVVEGRVVEGSGAPVVSARVELSSGARVIGATRTDADGRFRIETVADWAPGWSVRVERLGFEPAEVAVASGAATVEITLALAPLPLPGFEVVGDRNICAAGDDGRARSLWRAAARQHAGGLDTMGVASYTRVRTDTIGAREVASSGLEGSIAGQRASAPLLRMGWTRRVDREGYAFPVRRTDVSGSYDSWGYPPLEADFSSHFAGELFGELHDFQVELEDEDGWILHFCAREEDEPHLDGVLEIDPDTLIYRAEWRFYTEEPDEGAGGWARYPPATDPEGTPPLLPSESVVWKTLPGGEIVRRAQWYEGWVIAVGDSVPFLPVRP